MRSDAAMTARTSARRNFPARKSQRAQKGELCAAALAEVASLGVGCGSLIFRFFPMRVVRFIAHGTFICCFDKSIGACASFERMDLTADRVHHTHNDANLPVRKTDRSIQLVENESGACALRIQRTYAGARTLVSNGTKTNSPWRSFRESRRATIRFLSPRPCVEIEATFSG